LALFKYGIKLLTYWFDEGRGSAFCLIDAPAKEKVKQFSFTDRGESALKGFDQPFRIFEAQWQEA
jgi:hypothetical protein